jgi:ribonuclease J
VRPRYFAPIHGEYRQLSQHARIQAVMSWADHKLQVLLAENGDIIQFDRNGA